MNLDRRAFLGGIGALPLAAARDAAGAALDAAVSDAPANALHRLRGFDAAALSPSRRLDLETARAGLAIDAALRDRPDDYALRLRRQLGDAADPDAARVRIDAELARLHERARRLFVRIGLSGATIGDDFVRLFRDPRFLYADDDAGRDRAVGDMTRALAIQRRIASRIVAGVPAYTLACDVRALSAGEIAAGRQGYRDVPTPARPGAYVVDLKDIRRRPSWSLPGVVAHELLPGHMIQLGIEAVAPPHPLRVTYAAAFVEGWGVHAETLAAAAGAFADPRAMLGHLHWLIFRVVRARIDLGIHREGWSIAEAHARLLEWQGEPAYFAPFDVDLARIAREPATRVAEAMAWLTLADRLPRAAAGRPEWHRAVLAHGRKRIEALP